MSVEYNSQTVIVDLPHNRYVDKVLKSRSYEELMWVFYEAEKPSKEISESYAAFHHLKKHCQIGHFNWLHIGDGARARTASLFTFFSKSFNIAIDPVINMGKCLAWQDKYQVKNLWFEDFKFQDIKLVDGIIAMKGDQGNFFPDGRYPVENKYNITCVHAHVNLEEVDKHFPDWYFLYTNPCCKPNEQMFSKEYMKANGIIKLLDKEDLGILSDKRRVIIYKKQHEN